ncbi:hypothetical protein BD413DRAFT_133693 [Trametes elegans]|nr:hypothetical protein BD413DRAFT_133693 [Trametes elegans]
MSGVPIRNGMANARLPIEVCERVIDLMPLLFGVLEGRDRSQSLASCALTCFDWLFRCRLALYANVDFCITSLARMERFADAVTAHPELGGLVKSIDIRCAGIHMHAAVRVLRPKVLMNLKCLSISVLPPNSRVHPLARDHYHEYPPDLLQRALLPHVLAHTSLTALYLEDVPIRFLCSTVSALPLLDELHIRTPGLSNLAPSKHYDMTVATNILVHSQRSGYVVKIKWLDLNNTNDWVSTQSSINISHNASVMLIIHL